MHHPQEPRSSSRDDYTKNDCYIANYSNEIIPLGTLLEWYSSAIHFCSDSDTMSKLLVVTVLIIYLYYSIIAIYYSEKKNHEGFTYWQGYIRHISFTITLYI